MGKTTTGMGRWRRGLAALWLVVALAGCASGPKLVSHAFSFDGWSDKWVESIQLLEYSYGDKYSMVRRRAPEGDSLGAQAGVDGPMPVGEFLYVRWRIKATGEVLDQRVELRDRLPKDMTDHELTFVIDGRQLYVYVLTPEPQKPWGKTATHRTWSSKYNVTHEIYPMLEKPAGR